MLNILKKKISNNVYTLTIVGIITALVVGGFVWRNSVQASITTATVAPVTLGTDDIVGEPGQYEVSYTTTSTGTASKIIVNFPNIFTLDGSFIADPTEVVQSDIGSGGFISINGTDREVSLVEVVGTRIQLTLAAPFNYGSTVDVSDTISFSILNIIFNPETAAVFDGDGFTSQDGNLQLWIIGQELFVSDDSATGKGGGSTGKAIDNAFTIIPGQAVTLSFTTLPSMTPTPVYGDVQSGVVWTTQPVVTAYDSFGNIATRYHSDVVSLVLDGSSPGSLQFGSISPSHCGATTIPNSFQVRADNGVIDFSPAFASYNATTDHESFTLRAVHTCGVNGGNLDYVASPSIVADVVADTLVWTTSPSGCVSGTACATQGVVKAVKTNTIGVTDYVITDVDFMNDVVIGEDGPGSLVGLALREGEMLNGALTVAGIGYRLSGTNSETIRFTADSDSMAQGVSAPALVTPPTDTGIAPPPIDTGAGGFTTNPKELPGYVEPQDTCAPYLTSYMRLGSRGPEVTKLQSFLLKNSFLSIQPTGFFGLATDAAVKRFQEAYTADVLSSWGLNEGTGYVYITTTKKINELVCKQ
ncbi:MAG: peptidoglycan-binding protein [Candidatus Pacebacteria bacterium]|jgi:hypothetical protein|nr:peptidoglycan-binding protein [Candidatus Paceibacterota bacterium]